MLRDVLAQKVRGIEQRSAESSSYLEAILAYLEESRYPLLRHAKRLLFDLLFTLLVLCCVLSRLVWRNLGLALCAAAAAALWVLADQLLHG
ncbi:crescent membrane and immature virion formation protein [Equine molluscum contagiosum-like virus]|nr:crescent membrane and immature virion formation protein [Equine molluscum contagiosum-like virus]